MASGFLMTGHEVGAALGVAMVSVVSATAGSLTSSGGLLTASPAASSPQSHSAPQSPPWHSQQCQRLARQAMHTRHMH
jgi:hypothetical protein